MPQSFGLTQRLDPYKNYKFRLTMGNRFYFGGIRTGLFPSPDIAEYRSGDDPSSVVKLPGRTKYEPIALNRGVTQDPSFSSWASQVMNFGSSPGSEVSLANFRKTISLEFYNEAGQLVVTYRLNGNMVSEIQTKPPGVFHHILHPDGPGTLQEQFAAIFENSLRRSTG
jgi:phage tail-like protein